MVSVSKVRRNSKAGDMNNTTKLRRRKGSSQQQQKAIVKDIVAIVLMVIFVLSAWWMYFSSRSSSGRDNSANYTGKTIRMPKHKAKSSLQDNDVNGQHYSVVIVGAGIAGLTAAKTLQQHDPSSKILILEATSQWGGRIRSAARKSITNQKSKPQQNYFYPIDMGASFVTDPKWLPIIVDKEQEQEQNSKGYADTVTNSIPWDWTTTPASEEWKNMSTTAHDMMRNYSWYEFVQDHLLPTSSGDGATTTTAISAISATTSTAATSATTSTAATTTTSTTTIRYNSVVDKIVMTNSATADNNDKMMEVSCGPSFSVTADAVLVTVPLPLLQESLKSKEKKQQAKEKALDSSGDDDDDDKTEGGKPPPHDDIYDDDVDGGDAFYNNGLQFYPPLPKNIQDHIRKHKAKMLPAIKIVFEFRHKFYPDYMDILKQAEMAKDDDNAIIQEPPDVGLSPKRVYEYWADSDVRYFPQASRPKGAKHYLVGQILGAPAKAYLDFFYGPYRQNDYYRVSEYHDDMAEHLLQELINYLEVVEGFEEFWIRQNYVGYQIVHWTKETFMPGVLDCAYVHPGNLNNKKKKKEKNTRKNANQVGAVPHVHGRLYFAGEAFANLPRSSYQGCGQAHGAAISGKKAALQILHSLMQHSKIAPPPFEENSSHDASPSIPIPNESLIHRDLKRFSVMRPEDAADLKFYAPMNHLWKDPA
ncbi:MAG: hypothetical protein SGBAC_010930 [Bacillariaceae sp.]